MVWHNGGTGGYRSFAGFVKESRTAVVVLANSTEEVDPVAVAVLDILQR
jgi:CubicO group peptidase (beta-lactamase class C family)